MEVKRSSCTRGIRLTVLTALVCGSIALIASPPARAFILTVGPSNSIFGGTVCADVNDGSLNSPTNVQAWACNLAPNQQFEFSRFTIYTMGGQRCLDVYGDGTAPGTRVDSAYCNGTQAQVWYYYNGEVVSPKTQYCLDATNMANGTQLVINPCNGGISQTWQMKH